jgi:hypothetical protein
MTVVSSADRTAMITLPDLPPRPSALGLDATRSVFGGCNKTGDICASDGDCCSNRCGCDFWDSEVCRSNAECD